MHIRHVENVFLKKAHNLLDNFARGVQIDETLVYFEFVTIPGLGTFTARLAKEGGGLKA